MGESICDTCRERYNCPAFFSEFSRSLAPDVKTGGAGKPDEKNQDQPGDRKTVSWPEAPP